MSKESEEGSASAEIAPPDGSHAVGSWQSRGAIALHPLLFSVALLALPVRLGAAVRWIERWRQPKRPPVKKGVSDWSAGRSEHRREGREGWEGWKQRLL